MFGGTLALKGAIEEQRATKPPHCEDGCYGCEYEANFIFERWLDEQMDPWPDNEVPE